MEPRHWSHFADQWLVLAERWPTKAAWPWTIAGRALKAGERYEEARHAFETAIVLAPRSANNFLQLGHILRATGQRPAAITALTQAYTLGAEQSAARALRRYGARDQIPVHLPDVFRICDYSNFVESHPVPPPPLLPSDSPHLRLWIHGKDAAPGALEKTVKTVQEQTYGHWSVLLLGMTEEDVIATNVASDHRVSVANETKTSLPHSCENDWEVHISSGARLYPEALAWLAWTITNTPSDMIFCDHDHYSEGDESNLRRSNPVLHPMADSFWFSGNRHQPALIATKTSLSDTGAAIGSLTPGPHILAHIPHILLSVPTPVDLLEPEATNVHAGHGVISVIIPTRDNPALLKTCVETLLAMAAYPDRVEIVIVDNGSVLPETRDLFERLQSAGATIVPFNEAFNWSRANNMGSANAKGEHFLFLNDDTEMLTFGWDSLVSAMLEQDERAGILGAKMLYPNGTIQHAGFIFGLDIGPQHEGRWADNHDPGPSGRWATCRQAAAVTGAFMAIRRTVFEEIGPFDDMRYAVDFSDIDLCLRARSAGYAVLYFPQVTILHHESFSRGYNKSRIKRARAKTEYAQLRSHWGSAVQEDPGYNPLWACTDYAFDGYRAPSQEEIIRHIKASARRLPWKPGYAGHDDVLRL